MKETKFKQTDIGLIPEDWRVKPIGEFTEVVTGATPSTHIPKYWDNGTIKWMSSGEVNLKYVKDVAGRITEEGYQSASTHLIPPHCVLIGLAGQGKTRGTAAYNLISLCTNQSIGSILPNDLYCSLFLYHYMDAKYNDLRLLSAGDGGRGGLSKKLLSDYKVSLPPTKEEQERIANALSQMDNLIAALDEQIEKKKHIKQGTMQQLLTGKTRLQGFCQPWVEKTIEELGCLTGAGVDKKNVEDETPVRLLNYLDVFKRDVIFDRDLDFWTTADETKLQQCNVQEGDVFFTPSSEMPYDIALSAVAKESMPNVCYSYHIYRLRFSEYIDLDFKAYMFKTADFYNQANVTCEGSGKRYVISLTKFRKMKIFYPSDVDEQHAIANILSTMDDEIQTLQEERDKYVLVKQGMMQQLLTGKIRLN